MPYNVQIVPTHHYLKFARKLLTEAERLSVEGTIAETPDYWPVVAGTNGARKARIPLHGRGKRGGGRLIYYWQSAVGTIYLLWIYAKNQQEDLSHDQKSRIKELIEIVAQKKI